MHGSGCNAKIAPALSHMAPFAVFSDFLRQDSTSLSNRANQSMSAAPVHVHTSGRIGNILFQMSAQRAIWGKLYDACTHYWAFQRSTDGLITTI